MYRKTIAAALLAGAIAVGTAGAAVACPDPGGRESNEAHHHAHPGHPGHPSDHQHPGSLNHSGQQGQQGQQGAPEPHRQNTIGAMPGGLSANR